MALLGQSGETLAVLRIICIVIPAFLLYGYNQSNLGGVLSYPSFTKHFPTIDTVDTTGDRQSQNALDQGAVVSAYTLGCLFGALGVAPIGNLLGRRKSLILSAAVASVGIILQVSSYNIGQLVAGRVLCGIGNGGVNSVVPVWQSECTKPKSRGKNVVVAGIFITTGVAAAGWVNVGLSYVNDQEFAWRLPLAIPLLFCIMLLTLPMLFPESPRWLVSKGRVDEARQSLIELHGREGTTDATLEAVISTLLHEPKSSEAEPGYLDLLKPSHQRLFYRLCLAFTINFIAQMTGANVITYYGTTIFKDSVGLSPHKAAFLNAGVLTWKIVAATVAYLTVDRVGRKPLFIIACAGMSASMAGLAGSVWAIENVDSAAASILAVFFTFLFMAFFPLGFVGANFLYAAEIAPQELRIHLASIGTASHWLFNFVIADITPVAFVTIKWRYYIIYAVVGAFGVLVVTLFFPETKGLSLEDMGELFSQPSHFWQVPRHARSIKNTMAAKLENEGKEGIKATMVEDVEKE
ncbi:sugar transporter [Xylariaceae sp. FL1272]|nr:sugar transporter [Xylariaceae sp. FL1272]